MVNSWASGLHGFHLWFRCSEVLILSDSGSGTAADTLSSWVAGRAGYCWTNPFWKSRWKWYGNYMKLYETVFNCLMIYKSKMPGIRDATRLDDVGWQCTWSTKSGSCWAMSIWSVVSREIAVSAHALWSPETRGNFRQIGPSIRNLMAKYHGLSLKLSWIKSFRCSNHPILAGGPVPYPCRGRLTWWCWGWSFADFAGLGEQFYWMQVDYGRFLCYPYTRF